MLNNTSVDALQSSGSSARIQSGTGPAPEKEISTYLNTDNLPENNDGRCHGSGQRLVTTAQTSSLLTEADLTTQDSQGNTRLCLAAQAGDLAQAQQLIAKGADVQHINLDGDNLLTLAATGGHLTFITWLDWHCPQTIDHENYCGDTALTLAARHGHQPLVQWLVSRDAALTHLNDQLKDALAEAVANGHLTLAQWLSSRDTPLNRVYPDGNNLFLHAVRAGHQGIAQWLEESDVNSQQINEFDDNALTLAARHGHHQLLAWLLPRHPGGVHQTDRNGNSLVLIAARHGHCQIVKLLVQHGADIGLVNNAGRSALTLAAASSESLALWLCDVGADIHHIEFSGNNAFTLAAQSGFFQLMQTLERLGINIHQVNRDNDNAFTLVARQGSLPWCQWLAGKGIDIHQTNCQHHNAVTLAAMVGAQPLLQWLCEADVDWQQIPRIPGFAVINGDSSSLDYGFNAAIMAASAGHFTSAQYLIQRGLSIHQRDYFGRNAVILAVGLGQLKAVQWFTDRGIIPDSFPDHYPDCFKRRQYQAMILAACLGHLPVMQWLHQIGGSLDDRDDERVPLLFAVRSGSLPMTQWLCRLGADLERLDSEGAGALLVAARYGHLRLAQWLVAQGDENIPDDNDNDALSLAVQGGHSAIFRWLVRSASLSDRVANDLLLRALQFGHRSLAVWLCLKVCRRIHGVDDDNHNALMLAAKNGFLWLTQWLSEQTDDINQTNSTGHTALMLAVVNGHLPVVQWLYLEKNAHLQQKNIYNADALHLAVSSGQTETANWLIDQDMVLDPDYFRLFALRLPCNSDNTRFLQWLLRRQFPPELLVTALLDAARSGDIPALTCCLSAGISVQFTDNNHESCFTRAASSGSLATLVHLYHYSGGQYEVENKQKSALLAGAGSGNLHIVQWLWERDEPSVEDQQGCLFTASASDHVHIVKWLHKRGVDIKAKTEWGYCGFAAAIWAGNLPLLQWYCQQGVDIHQIETNGKGALSMAIQSCEPQVAKWVFQHGFHLIARDIKYAFPNPCELVLGMIFKMTSKIRRAKLYHSVRLDRKLWLLHGLRLDIKNENPSAEEADARFARFNHYNDNTLEHKCLVALANLIGQQCGTLEAGLKNVDSLPISADCRFNLRELVNINFDE